MLDSFLRSITPQVHGRVTSRLTTIQSWQSRRLSGTKVLEVGRTSNTAGEVLDVPPSGDLPIGAGYVGGVGGQQWTMLSRWNEPVHVKAPAHAVPISTIGR